jgi:hypothetical protein
MIQYYCSKCEQTKDAVLFPPSKAKRSAELCIQCLQEKHKAAKLTEGKRGDAWRKNRLHFPGALF